MKTPHFWSHGLDPYAREAAPVMRALLTPLANIYAWAGARRIRNAEPYKCDVPVICVGNVTVGGTGKTPVVAALRAYFQKMDIRAATLSRGYKGNLKGPLKVDAEAHTAADVGDEPLMLAQSGESWIGADRAEAGAAMVKDGVELVIMDDGLQNPGLQKNLSLLVIDSEAPFGNGYVIPKGPLREPISSALARAQAIVLMGDGEVPDEISGRDIPIIRAGIEPDSAPPAGPIVAFAGIGRPQKVFDALTHHGAEIAEAVPFPDHHVYSASDLKYLRTLAEERGAQLVTTEKDYIRLPVDERREITSWPVTANFENSSSLDEVVRPVVEALKS